MKKSIVTLTALLLFLSFTGLLSAQPSPPPDPSKIQVLIITVRTSTIGAGQRRC
jgi:hypothetical protein